MKNNETKILAEIESNQKKLLHMRDARPNCISEEAFECLIELQRLEYELTKIDAAYLDWIHGRCDRFHKQVTILSEAIAAVVKICSKEGFDVVKEPLMVMRKKMQALDNEPRQDTPLTPPQPLHNRFRFDNSDRN